jgi:hypothetical protein
MSIENLNPMIALASDPALFDFSEKVGKNYDLQIDQIGWFLFWCLSLLALSVSQLFPHSMT